MNIDFLKKHCKEEPFQHGLGFIILRMQSDNQLNFHTNLVSGPSRSPHNHNGNFDSKCIFGELKNIIYDYEEVPASDWALVRVTCKEGDKPEIVNNNIKPKITSEKIQKQGDIISHYYKNIHDFKLISKHACTRLISTSPPLHTPLAIKNKNIEWICPYKNKGTPKENWDIIDQILKDQDNALL
tara:strand:- start:511 stop:1062 length:552 start_codon:yes stop_codon:yes gene_type:complete